MDVGVWLRGLGLGQYEAGFRSNAIAGNVLADLTDRDLEKFGQPLGDRRRLLKSIAGPAGRRRLRQDPNPPKPLDRADTRLKST
jgi:hypothetical protein